MIYILLDFMLFKPTLSQSEICSFFFETIFSTKNNFQMMFHSYRVCSVLAIKGKVIRKTSMYCRPSQLHTVPGLGTRPPQRPRLQQRRNRAHKRPWHSLVGCFLELGDTLTDNRASGPCSAQGWE